MDVVERTCDILDTCVECHTRSAHVSDGLADDLQVKAAADTVGEHLSVGNTDMHE